MYQTPDGLMEARVQNVTFSKRTNDGVICHNARIITYADEKKHKLVSLLTNDFDMSADTIVAIHRRRWQVESLFKQIKQNFPLRYFYGESANAIRIQIWVTLIANLLLSVLQSSLLRSWSFSGLATIVRITLMFTSIWRSYSTIRTRTWKKCSQNPWNRLLKTLKTSKRGLIHAHDNIKYYL